MSHAPTGNTTTANAPHAEEQSQAKRPGITEILAMPRSVVTIIMRGYGHVSNLRDEEGIDIAKLGDKIKLMKKTDHVSPNQLISKMCHAEGWILVDAKRLPSGDTQLEYRQGGKPYDPEVDNQVKDALNRYVENAQVFTHVVEEHGTKLREDIIVLKESCRKSSSSTQLEFDPTLTSPYYTVKPKKTGMLT